MSMLCTSRGSPNCEAANGDLKLHRGGPERLGVVCVGTCFEAVQCIVSQKV